MRLRVLATRPSPESGSMSKGDWLLWLAVFLCMLSLVLGGTITPLGTTFGVAALGVWCVAYLGSVLGLL